MNESFLCVRDEGRRYALVQLEGKWETLEADRVPLPEGFGA